MNPISPYKNIEQTTKIVVEPYQLNSDIRNNIKINLKKKLEKKCNTNGFIDEIYYYKIKNDGFGKILAETLNGNVLYDIIYTCRICIPIINSVIIAQIKIINQEIIGAIHGPMVIIIPPDQVDQTIWNINENFKHNNKSNTKLKLEDFVCIKIIQPRINLNDTKINVIGKLLDFAIEEDVEKYFGNRTEIEQDNFL
jgi:DNA-directed RNA polymerase subunit E'/Rpb7